MYKIYKANTYDIIKYLLKTKFKEKFKLIYLDPPYNTGRLRGARKLFKDNFSNWETFMKNIINNCYHLLNKKGLICISINQKELFRLKNILDSVFGENLFLGLFPVKIRHSKR